MKKNRKMEHVGRFSVSCRRWSMICVSMLIWMIVISPATYGQRQHEKLISLNVDKVSVLEAIQQINRLSGNSISYKKEELEKESKKVTLNLKDVKVLAAVQAVLKGTRLAAMVHGEAILVVPEKGERGNKMSSITLKGVVMDANKVVMPGVTVKLENTSVGTATDVDGRFTLVLPVQHGKLEFSFVGYKKEVIHFTEKTETLEVILHEEALNLDEVNVISTGYQRISKREQASSVFKMDQSVVNLGAQTSVDQMLAGQVPGMMVLQSSGEPGATPKIRIRGTSSIIGARAPIWVLDGIILEDPVNVDVTSLDSPDAGYLIGNAIAGVNARDIESITVLKDASATAIYGVRAANGVIIVTTKKGKTGSLQVNYSGNATLNKRVNYGELELMNAGERIKLSQEIISEKAKYSQVPTNIGYEGLYVKYCNNKLSYKEFQEGVNKLVEGNTDWYDILFRNSISHNHLLSLSGGSDRTTYYASLGFADTPGTARGSEQKSYTALLKCNSWITDKVYAGLQLNASSIQGKGFHGSVNPNRYAYETSRAIPSKNDDGSFFYYQTNQAQTTGGGGIREELLYNILNEMKYTGADSDIANITAQFNFEWKIYGGLSYRMLLGYDQSRSLKRSWAEEKSNYVSMKRGYNPGVLQSGTKEFDDCAIPYGGILDEDEQRKESYTFRNTLNYNHVFGEDHFISVMGVQEVRSIKYKGTTAIYYGYMPDRGMTIAPAITTGYKSILGSLAPKLTDYVNNNLSWLGSFSYSYKDTWTLNANVRADGSNNLGENPEYRFLPVWSVAGKYTLSNERFMSALPLISYLAIRGSYGVQGNIDKSSTPHLIIQVGNKNSYSGLNESYFKYYSNPDLRWEKTKSFNIGVDFSIRGWENENFISGVVDVYKKKGSDMITQCSVSQVMGVADSKINGGELENRGIEGSLAISPVKSKDIDFTVKLIASYNKNELIKAAPTYNLTNEDKINGVALVEGKPLGSIYSIPFAGVNPDNGYPMYYNSKGEKRYELLKDEVSLVYSGMNEPDFSGGFDLSFRYKSFYFSAGFQYSLGGVARLPEIYGSNIYNALEPVRNVTCVYKERWKNEGDITNVPKIYNAEEFSKINDTYKTENSITGLDVQYRNLKGYDISDLRVVKTDNLRLRNVNLMYILPREWVQDRWGMESVTLAFQCQNLFLLADKRWEGRDPESGGSNTPLPKTFTFSVNVGF